MRIAVQFDTRALKVRTRRETKRLAFNTAQALNETAKAVQTAGRVNLDRKFEIRKAGFMYRLVKIFRFASARKGIPFAEVGIDRKQRVLLGIFEKGGERPPVKGKSVAVPVTGGPARPTFRQSVAESFTFKALRLRRRGRGGDTRIQGQQSTFAIPGAGVFRRVAERVEAVYLFIRGPRLEGKLGFVDLARRVIARKWKEEFAKSFIKTPR